MSRGEIIRRFKPGWYNHFIHQGNGTVLAYSSLSNALARMDDSAYQRYEEVCQRGITIYPTIGCNFACDYCFETKRRGKMGEEVQDAIVRSLEEKARRLERFPGM